MGSFKSWNFLGETDGTEDLIMLTALPLLKASLARHALLWPMALCIFLGGCAESATREAPQARTEGGEMVTLAIDLQDGFEDDAVVLRVNGEEVGLFR